jgi:hypothetical protein
MDLKGSCSMKALTGVFASASDAERAWSQFREIGVAEDRLTLLTPAGISRTDTAPTVSTEQPGMGKAIGALIGAGAGLSAGPLLVAALVPGVGPITAVGLLGGAVLAAAGASVGAVAGAKSEDALRKGRSVVIAMAENDAEATRFRELLATEGAESVDAAREQWWIGLRSAEEEHYKIHSRDFGNDEKFYRMGFESALHARTRCKEYDQVMGEMTSQIEDIEKQYPGINAAEAFEKGYKRGRDYYQQICNESKAA